MNRRYIRATFGLLLAAGTAACLELDIFDENRPDRDRALGDPASVEEVIGSLFHVWHNTFQLADVAKSYPVLADEATNTGTQRNVQWSLEPRQRLRNDETAAEIWIPRRPWDNFSWTVANASDALRLIKDGIRIITADEGTTSTSDNTSRAWVWGKLFQGIGLGYLVISMDRAPAVTEDSILPTGFDDLIEWERENIRPWQEVLPIAIQSIEEAIERAQNSAPFLTPSHWIPGQRYDNTQIIELAHTMIARLLVYSARLPEDREAVDWQKVLFHTERGLTYDFGPIMDGPDGWYDGSYLWRLNNTGSTAVESVLRADPRLLGPADQSGNYQTWLASPLQERDRFDISTPDRRVTGEPEIDEEGTVTVPNGAYFRYIAHNNGMEPSRGRYNFSAYGWYRRGNYQDGVTHQEGHFVIASEDENRLLRAEAMLRLNRIQEAVDLLNVTRTRGVKLGDDFTESNLPPLTVAGAQEIDGECVPRTEEGQCGSVLDALMWERQIELFGQNAFRAWLDRRGFGQLQSGTILHMPIPARYLVSLGIAPYTFGGVGGDGAAP